MLNTEPNISAPDDFYQMLVDIHRDLTPEQSKLVNAKLILLLGNHTGDLDVLRAAMAVRELSQLGRILRFGRFSNFLGGYPYQASMVEICHTGLLVVYT
jgi:Protein of unknown function (DUF2783)